MARPPFNAPGSVLTIDTGGQICLAEALSRRAAFRNRKVVSPPVSIVRTDPGVHGGVGPCSGTFWWIVGDEASRACGTLDSKKQSTAPYSFLQAVASLALWLHSAIPGLWTPRSDPRHLILFQWRWHSTRYGGTLLFHALWLRSAL